ncbi:alpha-amylase [Euzebyella marina]|uniref:Alpha-amylase n=1 Tax=Euzebyella marina TaxID=1761453 RepID=A0A3G2L612_9FLAO|nr:alpha-amylase family glycosyl hydrolase [Euzebyella marina]AYN67712.1 alpha-amylase [Euzebyella marina]
MTNIQDSVVYHVYPIGLLGAERKNSFQMEPTNRIKDLYSWLDHMQDLGCDILYIGPVFESTSHGYDTADYFRIDRRLGSNRNFKDFVERAHKRNIKVVLDGVFNHVGRNFWAFKDVLKKESSSAYKYWFSGLDFSKGNPMGDSFTYNAWHGHYQLVELDLLNEEVQEHLLEAVKFWIRYFNIDGLRLDTADILDFNFMQELNRVCKGLNPEFWLMGEVVQGDYNRWIKEAKLDSVTNYEFHGPFFESFNKRSFKFIEKILSDQFGMYGRYIDLELYSFVDNHDVQRSYTSIHHKEHLNLLYFLLFTLPGIPSIYYGSEYGYSGKKTGHIDDELRPAIRYRNRFEKAHKPDLFNWIKKLISIRRKQIALRKGNYRTILVSGEQFVYVRKFREENLIMALNMASCAAKVSVKINLGKGVLIDLLDADFQKNVDSDTVFIEIPPEKGRILQLSS